MSIGNCSKIKAMVADLKPIVSKNPMNQSEFKNFMTKYNLGSSESILKNINTCSNVNVNVSSNTIDIPTECFTVIKNACKAEQKNIQEYTSEQELKKMYHRCLIDHRPTIDDIKQVNISNVEQTCNIRSLLGTESIQANTELALTLKFLLGNYDISCEQGTDNSFKFLDKSNTAINVLNDCTNASFVIQSNKIDVCDATNVYQKNISSVIQNCAIKSDVENKYKIKKHIYTPKKQGQDQEQDQEQEQEQEQGNIKRIIFNPSKFKKTPTFTPVSSLKNINTIIFIGVIIIILICSSCSIYMYKRKYR
jgi:hypothetical protein